MTQEQSRKTGTKMDMLHGPLLGKLILFALPVAAGSILQQLFNSVDVAVVGRFSTSQALAAVGSNGPVISLLLNLFIGISIGTNVTIATYIGRRETKKIDAAVHTSICVALISGFVMLALGQVIARPLLRLMATPPDVIDLAVLYLRIYFCGMPFIMLYNFGAAVLRSVGDTKRPLYCLIVSGILNACLNVLFVVGFHMNGVVGVSLATVIANSVSCSMVITFLVREKSLIHLDLRRLRIEKDVLLRILRIGVPAGLQGMVFSISNVVIQSAINGFGSNVVAGSSVAINFEYISYFLINGFNQAATTFIGQNYGAGEVKRCRRIWILCLACGFLSCGLLNLTFFLFRAPLVGIFTTKAVVAHYAMQRMRYVLLFQAIASSYEITGSALRAYGYSMTPSILTVFGTCILRIVWVATIAKHAQRFSVLLTVYPVTWVVTGLLVIGAYLMLRKRIEGAVKA